MLKKTIVLIILSSSAVLSSTLAQNVGINFDGTLPNPNAMLDIKSSNKGILIPRTSTASRLAIPDTKGLLVYDTTTNSFWYNTGAGWQVLSASVSPGAASWALNGNIADSSSFIGPVNYTPFFVKVNGQLSGLIDPRWGITAWGYATGCHTGYGDSANTAFGSRTMQNLRTATDNTAVGANSMQNMTSGNNNTAVGLDAMRTDTSGNNNTAIGAEALWSATYCYNNTAVGA